MKCILRYTQRGKERVCQAMIVDDKRRLLDKLEGAEAEVRRAVEQKYPGIATEG